MNIALLVKWIWKLHNEAAQDTLSHPIIKAKYPGAADIFGSNAQGVIPFGAACIRSNTTSSWEPNIQWETAPQLGSGQTYGLGIPRCALGLLDSFRYRPIHRGSSPSCIEMVVGIFGSEDRLGERSRRASWHCCKKSLKCTLLILMTACYGVLNHQGSSRPDPCTKE
jgi:hypothetical protein